VRGTTSAVGRVAPSRNSRGQGTASGFAGCPLLSHRHPHVVILRAGHAVAAACVEPRRPEGSCRDTHGDPSAAASPQAADATLRVPATLHAVEGALRFSVRGKCAAIPRPVTAASRLTSVLSACSESSFLPPLPGSFGRGGPGGRGPFAAPNRPSARARKPPPRSSERGPDADERGGRNAVSSRCPRRGQRWAKRIVTPFGRAMEPEYCEPLSGARFPAPSVIPRPEITRTCPTGALTFP